MKEKLVIFTDGACSGNPGPAGVGVVIKENGETIKEVSRAIGEATNNIAEYTALIVALREALEMHASEVSVFTDSELMYKQVTGQYKIKQPHIQKLYSEVAALKEKISSFSIAHVRREKNKEADKLATEAIKSLKL